MEVSTHPCPRIAEETQCALKFGRHPPGAGQGGQCHCDVCQSDVCQPVSEAELLQVAPPQRLKMFRQPAAKVQIHCFWDSLLQTCLAGSTAFPQEGGGITGLFGLFCLLFFCRVVIG